MAILDFPIPHLYEKYFTPAVAALLRSRARSETCMQLGMACAGSFYTAICFLPLSEPSVPFTVIGTVAVIFMVAGVAIQWRSQRAVLATVRGDTP